LARLSGAPSRAGQRAIAVGSGFPGLRFSTGNFLDAAILVIDKPKYKANLSTVMITTAQIECAANRIQRECMRILVLGGGVGWRHGRIRASEGRP